MEIVNAFTDRYNTIAGVAITLLSFVFGKYWWLFALFLLFNFIDWISGWLKSRLAGVENSARGLKGIIKKFGYWLMILVSFAMSSAFIEIGEVIGVDLHITKLLGWFVLASLMVNELRSILENLVQAGYDVPNVLVKGLSVVAEALDEETNEDAKNETDEK